MEDRGPKLAPAQRQDRNAIYAFPMEFETVCQKLAPFVGTLFQSISQEKPILRGFYFVSSAQGQTTSTSFVMQNLAESFNRQASPPDEQLSESLAESKNYFIRDLFKKAVFSDRDPNAPTRVAQRRSLIVRLSACAVVFLIFLTLSIMIAVSYGESE